MAVWFYFTPLDAVLIDQHHKPATARAWICGFKTRAFQIVGVACVFWAWGRIEGIEAKTFEDYLKLKA